MTRSLSELHHSLRKVALGSCVAAIPGCSGPTDAQVAADFARENPSCTLEKTEGGDREYQYVWLSVFYSCAGDKHPRRYMFKYEEKNGEWVFVQTRVESKTVESK